MLLTPSDQLLLGEKLIAMQVVCWIVNYLTCRPQHVRLQHCASDRVISNTGAPQGTVLSPILIILFFLHTTDFNCFNASVVASAVLCVCGGQCSPVCCGAV